MKGSKVFSWGKAGSGGKGSPLSSELSIALSSLSAGSRTRVQIRLRGKDAFLRATEPIFTENADNSSMLLHVSKLPGPAQPWYLARTPRRTFTLLTDVDGATYSLQDGAPGTASPWGIAYVGPTSSAGRIGRDVEFSLADTGEIRAARSPWGGGADRLAEDRGVLVWSTTGSAWEVLVGGGGERELER